LRSYRIVVAGHGSLPSTLLAAAESIGGSIADAAAVELHAADSPDQFTDRLRTALQMDHPADHGPAHAGRARRVLILCDLLGGTPFNRASAMARRSPRVVAISGANLGMLLEAALAEGDLDDDLVERLLEAGRDGIVETERHHARNARLRVEAIA
jgi:N-acetylgalactosamine PTS system EIIA component